MEVKNEKGFVFKIDKSLTNYAHEDVNKTTYIERGLGKNIIVLQILKEDVSFGFILFDTDTQTPLSKELNFEAMACHIDALKFSNYERKHTN